MSEAHVNDAFTALNLPPEQIDNLTALGYTRMTPVQAQALPIALQGGDLIVQARTGSGKTAAFGIALLNRINQRDFGTQTLILCPTRELATQVAAEIRRLARYLPNLKVVVLCGGQAFGPQVGSLEHGAHIVIGTPGRIRDHIEKQTLNLSRVSTLVLDEADRMLDMGFSEDIGLIIDQTPATRQTLLFSATFPHDIESLSARYQKSAGRVTVEEGHGAASIAQHVAFSFEDSRQTAAQIFRAFQAPNGRRQHAVAVVHDVLFGRVGIVVADNATFDIAVQGDGGLCRSCRDSGQSSQGNQGFFH